MSELKTFVLYNLPEFEKFPQITTWSTPDKAWEHFKSKVSNFDDFIVEDEDELKDRFCGGYDVQNEHGDYIDYWNLVESIVDSGE